MKKYDKYKKPKLWSVTEWVDIDTGEMISKQQKQENYIIVNTKINYEIRNEQQFRIITRECKHKGQTKLKL